MSKTLKPAINGIQIRRKGLTFDLYLSDSFTENGTTTLWFYTENVFFLGNTLEKYGAYTDSRW